MDKKYIIINELQFYCITRWHRCSILTPHVINKVHIGPQFEYIISKRFSVSKTPFHSAHHALKLIKCQQVQQAATSYIRNECIYSNSLSEQKSETYINILEEDADNSTELIPEECTSSRYYKKQLVVKVFYAQFDLMKVTRLITLSLYPIKLMDKDN